MWLNQILIFYTNTNIPISSSASSCFSTTILTAACLITRVRGVRGSHSLQYYWSMSRESKNYKTSLCWHFMNKGHCSLFEKCYFAHSQAELRNKADPLPPTLPPQFTPVSIYKTQLCKYYMKGYCRSDTACSFAHGTRELQGMLVTSNAPTPPVVAPLPPRPDYGQAGQFLLSILKNMGQVFPEEVTKQVLIKKGVELVESGDLPQANQIINELVSSNNLSQRQKEQCQTILSNAYSFHRVQFGQQF